MAKIQSYTGYSLKQIADRVADLAGFVETTHKMPSMAAQLRQDANVLSDLGAKIRDSRGFEEIPDEPTDNES